MKERARTFLRGVVRDVLHTDDVGAFIRVRRLALKKKLYHREIGLQELRDILIRLGFERGRVVWVQSSWNEFYNLRARPSELISLMRDLLGPEGTLVMPAFPVDQDPHKVLEIDTAPSATGLLTEIFRRGKDVERSIHLTSSVCAVGPAANFLVKDHHHGLFAWGPTSPYCRLLEVDARCVGLGIGSFVRLTPFHIIDCLLYDELATFREVFDGTINYRWRRRSGEEGQHEFMRRIGRLNLRGYGRYFPSESHIDLRISNLETFAIDAKTAIRHGLELARKGITIYGKRPSGSRQEGRLAEHTTLISAAERQSIDQLVRSH